MSNTEEPQLQPLDFLQRLLELEEIPHTRQQRQGAAEEHLLISFGEDEEGRNRLCEVIVNSEFAEEAFSLLGEPGEEKEYLRIQCTATFPFFIDEEAFLAVHRMAAYLNCQMAIPGFLLHEKSHTLVFRALLWGERAALDPSLFLNLLAMIELTLDGFTGLFELLADGLSTFDQIKEGMDQQLPKSRPFTVLWP